MNNYPYEHRNFRFIGDPIDGLSFEEDKIMFIEFKTGGSNLSQKQRKIKELVEKGKIEWKEIRENWYNYLVVRIEKFINKIL